MNLMEAYKILGLKTHPIPTRAVIAKAVRELLSPLHDDKHPGATKDKKTDNAKKREAINAASEHLQTVNAGRLSLNTILVALIDLKKQTLNNLPIGSPERAPLYAEIQRLTLLHEPTGQGEQNLNEKLESLLGKYLEDPNCIPHLSKLNLTYNKKNGLWRCHSAIDLAKFNPDERSEALIWLLMLQLTNRVEKITFKKTTGFSPSPLENSLIQLISYAKNFRNIEKVSKYNNFVSKASSFISSVLTNRWIPIILMILSAISGFIAGLKMFLIAKLFSFAAKLLFNLTIIFLSIFLSNETITKLNSIIGFALICGFGYCLASFWPQPGLLFLLPEHILIFIVASYNFVINFITSPLINLLYPLTNMTSFDFSRLPDIVGAVEKAITPLSADPSPAATDPSPAAVAPASTKELVSMLYNACLSSLPTIADIDNTHGKDIIVNPTSSPTLEHS